MDNGKHADNVLLQNTTSHNTTSRCQNHELSAVGVSEEQIEFYGDAQKCERDMLYTTYRLSKELRGEVAKEAPDICVVLTTLQTVTKKFSVWKQAIDDLIQRQSSLPALKLDFRTLNQHHSMSAKCNLQNSQVKFAEGETIILTDLSLPNQVKVRNESGQEGYVPVLSCVLPSPDRSAASVVDRLQIHLLTYWFDCDSKIESSLRVVIANLLPTFKRILNIEGANSVNHHDNGQKKWYDHVTRLSESVADQSIESWNTMHTVLNDLENDLDRHSNANLNFLTEVVSNLDNVVVCYKGFRDDRCRFQTKLEQSSSRPIICRSSTDDLIRIRGRQRRYYVIKLTALDTVVTEETVHISNNNKQTVTSTIAASEGGMVQDGGISETTETEELTSVSHEENVKFVVRAVIDPRDGKEITIEEAVRHGIVNHQLGVFTNPHTGQQWPIPVAMNDGRILVERVVKSRSADEKRSIGIITISVQTDTREYVITEAVDMATGAMLTVDEARMRGIIDEAGGYFLNTKTQERIALSDAVDAGHVIADFDKDTTSESGFATPQCETKSFAICGVVDQKEKKAVPFNVAIRRGLIDRETGCYINNVTGDRVLASEAVKRGFFKCTPVNESSSLADIDSSNRVVADRIQHIRKNVLRNMNVMSAFKRSTKP